MKLVIRLIYFNKYIVKQVKEAERNELASFRLSVDVNENAEDSALSDSKEESRVIHIPRVKLQIFSRRVCFQKIKASVTTTTWLLLINFQPFIFKIKFCTEIFNVNLPHY